MLKAANALTTTVTTVVVDATTKLFRMLVRRSSRCDDADEVLEAWAWSGR